MIDSCTFYIMCVTAPAKVRKTFGFPDSRARSHYIMCFAHDACG